MKRLLFLSAARFFRRHPWQLALALVGISLGVAVYVGVQIANAAAHRAFDYATESAGGDLTHRLLPVAGRLPESLYVALARGHLVDSVPVVTGEVRVPALENRRMTLLGVEPLKALLSAGGFRWAPARGADLSRLIVEPGTVLVSESLDGELGIAVGDVLTIEVAGRREALTVVGTFGSVGSDPAAEPPLIVDIGTAQELLDAVGFLDRIDLGLSAAQARALEAERPPGSVLVSVASEDERLAQLTDAFTTNLTALGLLALVVGMFLIYATISFAIVQRRRAIAVLRAVGVSRRQLVATFLAEAAAMGAVGTAAGLLFGHLLATRLVTMVVRTLDDLYFRAAIVGEPASFGIYVEGAVLGLTATLLAALAPALSAARRPPATAERRGALERAARKISIGSAKLAIPVLGAAGLLLVVSGQNLLAGFAALFLVLAASAMATPAATIGLMRLVDPLARRLGHVAGAMAVRGVSASLSRTGVATAALAAAVATVMSIGIMISSFRASLGDWIDSTLTADIYLSAPGGSGAALADASRIAALPGVAGLTLTRATAIRTARGEVGLRAVEPGPAGWGFDIVAGDAGEAFAAVARGDGVLVAEPYAYQAGLSVGDSIELPTPTRPLDVEVVGLFRDYNTAGSAFVIALDTYRRAWRDDSLSGIGIQLAADADADGVLERLDTEFGGQAFRARSTAAIKRLSFAIFDRTFEVTEVLRVLAGIVAFLGILSSVLALELERAREVAVLRSIGMSSGQAARQTLVQTSLLGLAAGLLALPAGVCLAAILVFVINRRSFGWSMDLVLTPGPLAGALALALGAAVLAGIYPAVRSGRTRLDLALRDD